MIFRDEKIFIKPYGIDRVYIYSDLGDAHRIINHYGEGPGEYLALTDFDINASENQIVVSDAANRKFINYSYDGEFISEKPVNFSLQMIKFYSTDNQVRYIADLRYSNILPGQKEVFNINLFDEDWNFIKGYFPFSTVRGGMFGSPYMLFSKSDSCIGYYKPFTDSIFHFTENEMYLAYHLNFTKPVMSYTDLENSQFGKNIGDQIYNVTYDESTSHLFIGYMYQGSIYRLIYDKLSGSVKYFTFFEKDGSCSQRIFSYTLGVHESKLVTQSSSLNVDCIIDVFAEKLTFEQIQALNKVEEVDNNFLILVDL